MHPLLAQFTPVVKAIAKTFGDDCEVLLHDLSDLEHSIAMIENGQVTGRKVGGPITDLGLYFLQSDLFKDTDYVANYLTESEDGKKLKSSSIFIRDKSRKIVGFLCINYALDGMLQLNKRFSDFCAVNSRVDQLGAAKQSEDSEETFTDTLDALFIKLFKKAVQEIGKPIEKMQKEDKIELVRYLYKRGVFLVNGTIEEVAACLNVSRYTIYNYLATIKKKDRNKKPII